MKSNNIEELLKHQVTDIMEEEQPSKKSKNKARKKKKTSSVKSNRTNMFSFDCLYFASFRNKNGSKNHL